MTQLSRITVYLLLVTLAGCTTTQWQYPYPEVPEGKPVEKKAYYLDGAFRYDAVEKNPKYKDIFKDIDSEVNDAVDSHPYRGEFGFVHIWHEAKRRILYWRYGIDWHPVDDLTPGLMLD